MRNPKTFVSDLTWQKRCRAKLNEVLEDKDLARKALAVLLDDKELMKELPKPVYLKVIRNAI